MKTKKSKTSRTPKAPAAPVVPQPLLREKVREVMALAPGRKFTESMLLDAINRIIPFDAAAEDIRLAVEWNHESGFIDYSFNRDEDRDEWKLTERGREKEGLK
jgi:hypothetical protein